MVIKTVEVKQPDTPQLPPPDWERIEADFRAGVMSLREIASPYKITETAIRKRAKRDGWDRDLSAKIHARAESLVRKAEVRKTVRSETALTDRQIIEGYAENLANIQGGHKDASRRAVDLSLALMAELEMQTGDVGALSWLGEVMRKPDEAGQDKLNDLYQKVISTPSRIDSGKKVAEMLKTAIGMQQEAWGMKDKSAAPGTGEISITF